jgi:hypothetical protein
VGWLKNLLGGGGITPVVDSAGKLLNAVDQLSTSAEEKAEIRADVIKSVVNAQSAVLVAEATSSSWLARNWRPLLATQWGLIVTYTFFIGPMFALPVVVLPDKVFSLLSLMITGYAGARTLEKAASAAAPLMSGRQALKKLKLEKKLSG